VPGLGALTDLQFDHLDLVVTGDLREQVRIEGAIRIAAAEITRTDFPDQIAAILAMIIADAALAGIVREVSAFRARIERTDRIGTERAKTHGGNIEHRGGIRLQAIGAADGDAKMLVGRRLRRHRVMHPFIAVGVNLFLGSERAFVEHHLGALIDDGAPVAAERLAILLALEKILPHLGPDFFQQKTDMRRDRIVAQHRMALLQQVVNAEHGQ